MKLKYRFNASTVKEYKILKSFCRNTEFVFLTDNRNAELYVLYHFFF